MGIRGVWSLENVEIKKPQDDWVDIPNVWVTPSIAKVNTGYIGGGSPAANIDKLNFSNDTKTGLGYIPLNASRKSGGVGGNTHGYFGGKNPGYTQNVDKLVYATDTSSHSPTSLSAGRGYLAGCNSETNGYFVGGAGSFNTYVSIVDRITHATDTLTRIPSADLPSANTKQSLMATTASPGAAYIQGGVSPATTAVSKLTFSTEASAQVPGAAMITARGYATTTSNGTNTYIYGGGTNNNGSVQTTDIDKTVFASDTTSNIPANMPTHYNVRAAATGNTTFGIIAGGYSPGPAIANSAFKFTYGSESVATAPGYNLSNGKKEAAGISARNGFTGTTYDGTLARWFDSATETGNKMYCIGGTSGNDHDTFNMTTETAASLSLPGMPSMSKGASAQNTTHSYIHAGSGKQTKVRKITWSTNTGTTLPGTTSRNAESKSGVGNETKGYFTQGGSSPGPCYSGSDRVTYASDTIERVPGADMVGGRPGKFGAQATGNQDTGYFMGGGGEWPGFPNYSDTNKLTYATDTNANCPAQMPTGMSMYAGSSASSSTAAYASNYRNPSFHSKVFKLVFATDTIDTVGNTTVQRNGPAMGGNSTTMYMGGGSNFPNGNRSDFDKLVYATDTFSNLPDANLQSARYYTTGSGQRGERIPIAEPPTATPTSSTTLSGPEGLKLEGYIGKGRQPAASNDGRTDVTKFSYSTETWSSSVSGTMPVARKFPGATSNTTRGYWAGGTPGTNSQIDKFVWSTNTGSTLPASVVLSAARGYMTSAAGNQTQGYWAFGNGDTDACDKMTYSNETMFTLPSMPFGTSRGMGVSMQTHGYYGSGAPGGSRFAKITFANDTKTQYNGLRAHPSGSNMFRTAASSNTKVYVCSGESSSRATESIPWATDSVSQLPTTFMPADVTGIAGQGDNTNAYFTGGPGPGGGSMTQRVVYSSDTVSVLPGANFPGGDVNSYAAGGPGMNGIANAVPNVI